MKQHAVDVAEAQRFEFGRNWKRFLRHLDDERIAAAEQSLKEAFAVADLEGKTFLDVGSGSGLFSLAARRLGAHVHSFDYDRVSVACTAALKRRYFPDDPHWTVEEGNVLDEHNLRSLGQFDLVYAYGVLHHTGDMWRALANVVALVRPEGNLFLALYNDQGDASRRWRAVKRAYNGWPRLVRSTMVLAVGVYFMVTGVGRRLLRFDSPIPKGYVAKKKRDRGMSVLHDLIDWVGGYPFEVAKPEEVFDYCHGQGFILLKLLTVGGGHANNVYVFRNSRTHV